MLENSEDITAADWDTKCQEIRDKHLLERAGTNLIDGGKAWIMEHGPNKNGTASRMERPADGLTSAMYD